MEAEAIGEATGSSFFARHGALVVEPFKGREASRAGDRGRLLHDDLLQAEARSLTAAWAEAVLMQRPRPLRGGLRRRRARLREQELGLSLQSRVELVEAAVRLGRTARATESVRTYRGDRAGVSGTPCRRWAPRPPSEP
ncbi:hypothetical protein [Streptomyces sp. KL116D]|uniref:hypothetical protein n=1 Tax=Streptomyces sp. KL116D TaxID=3045152 RepID=UPI003556833E